MRAAAVTAAALVAAPAMAGDHVIYQRDNFTLNANAYAALYTVFASDIAFGGVNGQGESGDVNNFEYVVKPGLTATWNHGEAGEIYGGFNFAASGAAGDGDPAGFTDGDTHAVRVDDGYIGWRGDVVDFSVGRQQFIVGDQFLIGQQVQFVGKTNPWFWSYPFRAYDMTAIMRFDPEGPVRGDAFWIKTDETQGDTEIGGLNVEYLLGEEGANGKIGGMLAKVMDESGVTGFGREGMIIYNVRANGVVFDQMPNLALNGEFVYQGGETAGPGSADRDATGWYVEPQYTFANVMWSPVVAYRYASFSGDDPTTADSEGYDSLTYYFGRGWGTWYQGEISGEYYVFNTNLNSHMVKLAITPLETVTITGQYFRHEIDEVVTAGLPAGSDDLFADELNINIDWVPTDNWYIGATLAYAMPGDGGNALLGGTDEDMFLTQGYVQYTW